MQIFDYKKLLLISITVCLCVRVCETYTATTAIRVGKRTCAHLGHSSVTQNRFDTTPTIFHKVQ